MFNLAVQQRIAALPLVLCAELGRLCKGNETQVNRLIERDLFLGYFAGYPVSFDNLGDTLGGAIRKVLFDAIYAQNGEEFSRRAIRLLGSRDPETKAGYGFGVPDGERFLQALSQDKPADDCTLGLKAMFQLKVTIPFSSSSSSPTMDELAARKKSLSERLDRFSK